MKQPLPLVIRPALIRHIREIAAAAWPHEACGLIEGEIRGDGGSARRIIPSVNHHENPTRSYLIDPEDFLYAERTARQHGRTIMGVWHSHPHGDEHPSATDLELAWSGWSYLIAGVTNGTTHSIRGWRLRDDHFVEQKLRIPGTPA